MEFFLVTTGMVAFIVLVLVLIGRSYPGSGADLLDSTPRQILLQRVLGLPTPRHAHLPLLLGDDGRKLSKSEAALPVDAAHPLQTLYRLWQCLGQAPLPLHAGAARAAFLDAAIDGLRPAPV